MPIRDPTTGRFTGGGGGLSPIVVPVVLDEVGFQAGLKSMDKGMTAFTKRMGVMANKIGNYGLMASGALAAMGLSLLKSARDAESASLKFHAVFREAAEDTMKFAVELGNTFNMTTSEVQGFLGQIQDLFVPMGMSRVEAAKLSASVVDLSTRLAVFNGQPTALTLQNISSGLIGITRSVRQYGILIDEARVKQEIMNQGWVKSASEITQQQKVLARLNIMLADSADAMAKAPELVATTIKGQMDRVARAFQDLREELGFALAPVLEDLVKDIEPVLKDWVEWVKANRELIVQLVKLLPMLVKMSIALKGIGLAAKGLAAIKIGLTAVGAVGAGAATAIAAAASGAAYLHYKAARIRIQAQEDAAKYLLKQTDIQLKSLLKHERKLRLEHARKVAGESVDAFFDVFRDKFQEGSQAVEPFMRVTLEMIGKASREELGGLESEIDTLLMTTHELTLEQHTKLIGTINARLAEFYAADAAKVKEIEEKKAQLRVETFEAAMTEIQGSVVRNLNAELDSLRRAVAEQERIREGSLQRVMEIRAEMLQREIDHEQFLWEAALQDPAVATEERYFETEQRIEELIDSAGRAADEGNTEVMRRLLDMAERLSKSLISIDEHTYETRLADARDYLETIEAMRDEAAEAEIAASKDAAVEATRNIEGLKIVMESYILDVEDKLEALARSASDIPLTLDVSQALASIAEVMEAMEKLLQGTRAGAGAGVAGAAQGATVNINVPGGQEQSLADHLRASADAIEAGEGG